MSRKTPHPQQCPRCQKFCSWFSGKICHNCYRREIWKPKLIDCKRCHRQRPMQAKGYCNSCYNYVFHLQRTKDSNAVRSHNITIELYREITQECILCSFNKIVDLHHLDENHSNNNPNNMVGLCPNHHKMLHILEYRELLKDTIERLMILKRVRPDVFEKTDDQELATDCQTLQPITISIRKENLVSHGLPN